jgi:hypothetical protein
MSNASIPPSSRRFFINYWASDTRWFIAAELIMGLQMLCSTSNIVICYSLSLLLLTIGRHPFRSGILLIWRLQLF